MNNISKQANFVLKHAIYEYLICQLIMYFNWILLLITHIYMSVYIYIYTHTCKYMYIYALIFLKQAE